MAEGVAAATSDLLRRLDLTGATGGLSPVDLQRQETPHACAAEFPRGIAVGLITDPKQAEKVITDSEADMVALGRAMLYNPRWGWRAAAELGGKVDATPPYWRCPPREAGDIFVESKVGAR